MWESLKFTVYIHQMIDKLPGIMAKLTILKVLMMGLGGSGKVVI